MRNCTQFLKQSVASDGYVAIRQSVAANLWLMSRVLEKTNLTNFLELLNVTEKLQKACMNTANAFQIDLYSNRVTKP
jgi:hypothetical protein